MLYCNLQVFFGAEIAVEKHFDPQNVTSGGASGASEKFSWLTIARHILGPPHKLCCNLTTGRKACMGWSWAAAYRGGGITWGLAHSLLLFALDVCSRYHRYIDLLSTGTCM